MKKLTIVFVCLLALNCGSTKSAVVSAKAKSILPTMNLAITHHNFSLFRDSMTTEFMKMGLNVIDRSYVEKILQEHAFSQSGLTNPKNRKELGKLLGASAIVILDFTPGDSPQANVQVIDIETGVILISASYAFSWGFIPNHAEVTEIIGHEIRRAIDK